MTSTEDPKSSPGMAELLDAMEPMKSLSRGDFVDGIVMRIDEDGILVSTSQKQECVIPLWEMRSLGQEALRELNVGDHLLAMVVKLESDDSPAILSLDKAKGELGWRNLEKSFEEGQSAEGTIIGFNRGGAIVDVDGVQGFVPMSQLVSVNRELEGEEQEEEGQSNEAVGQVLNLKILELDRKRNRAILSERSAMQEWKEVQKERLVQELKEGDVVKGRVTGISTFGAFIDLGGADGLVHISELSWDTVNSPADVVKIGDELEVYVLKVDKDQKKISLSLRRTQPTPWDTIHQRYREGQIVEGTVTKLANFGAFARVENGIEGLVHISELADRMIQHPRDVIREGEVVNLKILKIESDRRRLGLSLKQAEHSG